MTDLEFKKALARGLSGGYLFYGEEDYLKRHYLSEARRALISDEAFRPFNHLRLDRNSLSRPALLDAITTPPFMSEKKLVELSDVDFSDTKAAELEALLDALAQLKSHPETVLILYTTPLNFDAGTPPRRPSSIYKRLCEVLTPVAFEYGTVRQLAGWARRHFEKEGVAAPEDLCAELVGKTGRNMFLLASEIAKLTAYVKATGRDALTGADIRLVAGADIEWDTFALANAILEKNTQKAYAALSDMNRRKVAPDLALAGIARVYADLFLIKLHLSAGLPAAVIAERLQMHEYRVKLYAATAANLSPERLERALGLCAEADLAVKGRQSGYTALERLVCEAAQIK